jgi:bacteriocin biosynthesis cyclodehydratase domain-containing protein
MMLTVPRRLRLKPTIDVFTAPDGCIHLFRGGEDDFVVEPDGRPLQELLEALDGTREWERLTIPAAISVAERAQIVAQLWELGVLEDAADDDALGERALRRYERQLRYFGDVAPPGVARGDYQRRLAAARVVVLGLGGLGGWAAYALACAGVGTLVGVDGDVVDWSNLNRQILYTEADLGQPKATVAARTIAAFNSDIDFQPVQRMLSSVDDVEAVVAGADFVVDAADQPAHEIERWVNAACARQGVPYTMMSQFPPLVRVGPTCVPGQTGCYSCQERSWRARFPLFDALVRHRQGHPSPAATFGPACGLVGSQVAVDVVHYLSGVARPATLGAAVTIDLRTLAIERTEVERDPDCEVCGTAVLQPVT